MEKTSFELYPRYPRSVVTYQKKSFNEQQSPAMHLHIPKNNAVPFMPIERKRDHDIELKPLLPLTSRIGVFSPPTQPLADADAELNNLLKNSVLHAFNAYSSFMNSKKKGILSWHHTSEGMADAQSLYENYVKPSVTTQQTLTILTNFLNWGHKKPKHAHSFATILLNHLAGVMKHIPASELKTKIIEFKRSNEHYKPVPLEIWFAMNP